VPADWPGGVRRVGGVSLVCCACMERGKAGADMTGSPETGADGKREDAVRLKPEARVPSRHPLAGRLVVVTKLL
jgi:hypothetical protein